MGLIKWLKKEGTSRLRRDSEPPRSMNPTFDPNRTRDDSYRESMAKFTQYRTNERSHRQTINTLPGTHSIGGAHAWHQMDEQTVRSARQMPQGERPFDDNAGHSPVNEFGGINSVDSSDTQAEYPSTAYRKRTDPRHAARRRPRHSMPTTSYKQKPRRAKPQAPTPNPIQERDEVKEFELLANHCYRDFDEDVSRSAHRSPPFHKINSIPFPGHDGTASVASSSDTSTSAGVAAPPTQPRKCPEKPKRLTLNNRSRKMLTEAHFTGAYNNFEMQSPFFSGDSSTSGYPTKPINSDEQPLSGYDSMDGDASSQATSTRYQIIRNKHGDEVEYALPCAGQQAVYHSSQPPSYATSADSVYRHGAYMADECARIINGIYERGAQATSESDRSACRKSGSDRSPPCRKSGRRVPITDLDKSTDSGRTFHDSDGTSKKGTSSMSPTTPSGSPNLIWQYYEHELPTSAGIVAPMSEFRPAAEESQGCRSTPLFYEHGTFRAADVMIRRYMERSDGAADYNEYGLITETAILREANVLRKIRHPNAIMLMALVFEPTFDRIGLIMEPASCSLHHLLFAENKMLELDDVVTIVKKISTAAVYLNHNSICHSNISSHTILIADRHTDVRLSAFELALELEPDKTTDGGDTAVKFNGTKLSCVSNGEDLPDCSMSSEQKIERYKQLSRAPLARAQSQRCYANAELRDVDPALLPHSPAFRQYFSQHYYQAPELLPVDMQLVYASKQTDAYGVTLLLWELLNRCIPFVIYNEDKHKELLSAHYPLKFLPIIEEQRCQRFNGIFERGLKREPQTRIDLATIIHKLNAIEVDIQVESDKQSRCDDSMGGKSASHRPPHRADPPKEAHTDKATPDRHASNVGATLPSPLSLNTTADKSCSQLSAANISSLTDPSPLNYHKLFPPRRVLSGNAYNDRTSTLKTAADSYCDSVDDGEAATSHASNDFNNAQTRSAIFRELSFANESMVSLERSTKSNGWNHSLTEYGAQSAIVRDNQMRRRNWMSAENVSRLRGDEPVVVAVSHIVKKRANAKASASPNGRKLNVSIKIVRSQLSPVASVNHNDSTKSEYSLAGDDDDISTDVDNFSIESRIKFFRSLESKSRRRSPPKNRANFSHRSEITFNEAQKASEKSQRFTYPQPTPSRNNLLQEIPSLLADIQQNIADDPTSSGRQNGIAALRALFNMHDDDDDKTSNSRDDGHAERAERPSSVRETVQKIELSIRSDKSQSGSFSRSAARNESHKASAERCDIDSDTVADEKVEEVMHVHEPSDTENECGAVALYAGAGRDVGGDGGEHVGSHHSRTVRTALEPSSRLSQTLIKRTYYEEVICDPNASGHNASIATKSLTTRVTLNMRQCKRRASDVGFASVRHTGHSNTSLRSGDRSPHLSGVRHSIASPIRVENRVSEVLTTSGRKLAELQSTTASSSTIFQTKKQIQSIEDLYIDDDFGGISLAANMKLFTNSTDSLDGIDFDLISRRILEQTSNSLLETSNPADLKSIEPAKITEITDDTE